MKWFKHLTDSHTNFKHRKIINELGVEGYGVYWLCVELVGQQGKKYCIKAQEDWKIALKDTSRVDNGKLEKFLTVFAQANLICPKSLEKGDLAIPKMKDYADEYSTRISRYTPDNVGVDKIRIDKIILHYIKTKNWEESIKSNPSLQTDIFKRNVRPAKQLLLIANNDELALKAISNMEKEYNDKNLNWTLETVIKHFAEFVTPHKPQEPKARTP